MIKNFRARKRFGILETSLKKEGISIIAGNQFLHHHQRGIIIIENFNHKSIKLNYRKNKCRCPFKTPTDIF